MCSFLVSASHSGGVYMVAHANATVPLIGKQRIVLHCGVHLLANLSYHAVIFRMIEHVINERGDEMHQIFFRATGGDGCCAKAQARG